jgi:hypothetical protein
MAGLLSGALIPHSMLGSERAKRSESSPWVTPSDAAWPNSAEWDELRRHVGGRLIQVHSPFEACSEKGSIAGCERLFEGQLTNPYFIGDNVALTQTLGWVGAWQSMPSAYAVVAEGPQDVAAAVIFARKHGLRIAVKGGGHSYHGTSNAIDSLLIWTRQMSACELYDAFVPEGCNTQSQPAISLGAGSIWAHAYDFATTRGKRYVQGGGCMTVGVAGLVQSGGFGSFSKRFGTVGSGLLEAEVVTANGEIRIANRCTNPDLFWALKGGGGGNFGVVTRVTLITHDLPETFGAVIASVKAKNNEAFRSLVDHILRFYRDHLLNPNWGEQLTFGPGNQLSIQMVFQGISQDAAEKMWLPFFAVLRASPGDYTIQSPITLATPAQHFWNPTFLKDVPGLVQSDNRQNAPSDNIFWTGDAHQSGRFLHAMKSTWLPASLLNKVNRTVLRDSLFAASRTVAIELHCNKGLAGASREVCDAALNTPMNPIVTEAFALAICASGEPPAYPGIAGHEPHVSEGHKHKAEIDTAIAALRKLPGVSGSYVSESDYFEENWQHEYWGKGNYSRLCAVKKNYDPEGIFRVHHGVEVL